MSTLLFPYASNTIYSDFKKVWSVIINYKFLKHKFLAAMTAQKTHNSVLFILPVLSEKAQRIPSWVLSHLAERNQGSAAVLIQVDHGDELYFQMLKYKDTDQNLKQTKGLTTII